MRRLSKQPAELDVGRPPGPRDSVDSLKRQADLLTGLDRTLLMMYIQAGCSFQQLARLTGRNRSSVGRRIRKIIRRLSDRTYLRCQEKSEDFTDVEMAVIRDHFIHGLSLQRICGNHNLCYYRARVIIEKARRIARREEGS